MLQQHEPHPALAPHPPQQQKTNPKLTGSDHSALQPCSICIHGLLQKIDSQGEQDHVDDRRFLEEEHPGLELQGEGQLPNGYRGSELLQGGTD